jgi:uncharacterized protein YjiS (DUF1127 family)
MPIRYHQRFANWLRYRYTLHRLQSLDDRLLTDMGLSRNTVAEKLKQADRQKCG